MTSLEQFDAEVARLRAKSCDGSGLLPQHEHADWKLVDVVHETRNIVLPLRTRVRQMVENGGDPLFAAKVIIALDRFTAMANGIVKTIESTDVLSTPAH